MVKKANGDEKSKKPRAPRARPTTPTLDVRAFVEVWQTSANLTEVAQRAGTTERSAFSRAGRIRKKLTAHGGTLKRFGQVERARLTAVEWSDLATFSRSFDASGDEPAAEPAEPAEPTTDAAR